jgi:hypothetical protein
MFSIFGSELHLPTEVHLDVMALLLWHIWKAINGLIFEQQDSSAQDVDGAADCQGHGYMEPQIQEKQARYNSVTSVTTSVLDFNSEEIGCS